MKPISRKFSWNWFHEKKIAIFCTFFFGFLLHTVVGAILIIFFQWWQWTAKGQQCGKFLCSKNMINNNRFSCASVAIFYVCLRIENKFKHSFGWKVKKKYEIEITYKNQKGATYFSDLQSISWKAPVLIPTNRGILFSSQKHIESVQKFGKKIKKKAGAYDLIWI